MVLRGRKVTLRAIEESDLELLKELLNDPEIESTVVGRSFPVSSYQQKKWFEKNGGSTDELLRLIIETEKDGAVGMVCLGEFDWINRVAHRSDIKILSSKVTDSGIAIDAMITLLGYGFVELNLNRIEGSAFTYNKRADALNKYLGFEVEGIKRQAVYKNGKYRDLYMLAILKEDFLKRNGKRFSDINI